MFENKERPSLSQAEIAAIARQTADIMRGGTTQNDTRKVVEHTKIVCDQNGKLLDADHPDPHGAMRELGIRNATFSGAGTVHRITDSQRKDGSTHAFYIPDIHGEFPEAV